MVKRQKWWKTGLKIGITLAGLWWALSNVSLGQIAEVWVSAELSWLIFAFLLMVGSIPLRAYRWWLLLRGVGAQVSIGHLIKLYFIGAFFNTFLPSGFGGDVVRVVEAAKDVPTEIAAGTVIVDRLTGLLMLFALVLPVLVVQRSQFPPIWFAIVLTLAIIGLLGGYLLFSTRLFIKIIATVKRLPVLHKIGLWLERKISPIFETIRQCGGQALRGALAVSFVFNSMLVLWWWAVAEGLGLGISMAYMMLFVPVMSIALLVPSIGGLGVRESLAPSLLAAAAVPAQGAVALTLTVLLLQRLSGLVGAPIYAFSSPSKASDK